MRNFFILSFTITTLAAQTSVIPLSGTWRFRLDAEKSGAPLAWQEERILSELQRRWQEGGLHDEPIFLPGSTDQAGIGLRTSGPARGWLSRPYIYEGPAWYQRDVVIPGTWKNKRIVLFLERPHWETQVWIDGKPFGMQNSLVAAHVYDLGTGVGVGRHTITIRVDNTYKIDVGRNAHSVTEHTQTNWNGIVGRIELRATDPVWVERAWIETNFSAKTAKVVARLGNATGKRLTADVTAGLAGTEGAHAGVDIEGQEATVELLVPLGAMKPWDEYEGNVGTMAVQVKAGPYRDEWRGSFGLREFSTRNRQFVLNGRPVFLRGTLECNIFPLTGYPPTDVESWARLFRIARSYGLNHFRFHSWCPPEAAFQAADEAGFLLHVELPVWNRTFGQDPAVPAFMREEGRRMQEAYGNHPSFTMLCLGNEMKGDYALMDQIVSELKARDHRRLYAHSTDYERFVPGPSSDYYVSMKTERGTLRIHGPRFNKDGGGADLDFSRYVEHIAVPTVVHELGDWVTYPDYSEISKYTGVLKPRNLEAFRATAEARGMADQSRAFQLASGKFAWLLYKEDIETALRTPNFGGIQLLQLQDFPGQGEALIGLLDSFWQSKGILAPEEVRGFLSETVPLARFAKFVWTNDEAFSAKLQLAHYGKTDLNGAVLEWRITSNLEAIASGTTPAADVATGTVVTLGEVKTALHQFGKAAQLRLEVKLAGAATRNTWDFWVYPKRSAAPESGGVLVTRTFDAAAKRKLEQGGKVMVLWPAKVRSASTLPMRFLPTFWSLSWFPKQPGTLGILCDPSHPALKDFPTDFHSNFQWWELTEGAQAFVLDDAPSDFRPLIQVIDDYHRNHKLGAVFETSVGSGKLLVSSLDLESNLEKRPVARQLLGSLLNYMNSAKFSPSSQLDSGTIRRLFGGQE